MDAELINQIVKQVLTAMGQTPVGAAAPAKANIPQAASPAAPSRPKAVPAAPAASAAPAPRAAASAACKSNGKKVFLTADMLLQRLAGLSENAGTLELEACEFLTPSAEDLAADRHVAIQRKAVRLASPSSAGPVTSVNPACAADSAPSPTAQAAGTAPGSRQSTSPGFGLVTSKLSDAAGSAIRAAAHVGLNLEDWNRKGCWLRDSRTMCEAILAGTLAGGIVVLPYAADAMLLTSRFRGIRPVQGARPESVASALRHYGANLLVIEHAFSTFHEMREMIRLFTAGRGQREQTAYSDLLWRHVGEAERS